MTQKLLQTALQVNIFHALTSSELACSTFSDTFVHLYNTAFVGNLGFGVTKSCGWEHACTCTQVSVCTCAKLKIKQH